MEFTVDRYIEAAFMFCNRTKTDSFQTSQKNRNKSDN